MATKITYYADENGKPLLNHEDGFVIKGNIYAANGTGGLVGNNFPEQSPFTVEDVSEVAFSKKHLLKVLGYSYEELRQVVYEMESLKNNSLQRLLYPTHD